MRSRRAASPAHPLFRAFALVGVGLVPGVGPAQQDTVFRSEPVTSASGLPTTWRVSQDTTYVNGGCVFLVRPLAWDSLQVEADSMSGAYTIWLESLPGSVESHLATRAFEQRDSGWVVLGRHGIESPARRTVGPGWRGVRGTAVVGCHRIEGGYVGICDLEVALIGTDRHTVELQSHPSTLDVFEAILATLELR